MQACTGRRLDEPVARTVPGVCTAVKWKQSSCGLEGQDWLLALRCCMHHAQVQFFRGSSPDAVPPGASTHEEVGHLDLRGNDEPDAEQPRSWIEQVNGMPDEKMGPRCRADRFPAAFRHGAHRRLPARGGQRDGCGDPPAVRPADSPAPSSSGTCPAEDLGAGPRPSTARGRGADATSWSRLAVLLTPRARTWDC